ncbi:hypothetical protein DFH11DRAFT_1039637 [Phellopilus nigrolimitatus]|nr:hypothetical protein DFH11DRAFT_258773 [Phellopilus nigrolimitatus]KAH8117675.1 hypothetical protein DFH11DRAFT_1039637 [Phellopilus nigrolimitatus]
MRFQWNASTLARFSYFILVLILGLLLLVSCVFLLSQAVRTAPDRSWFGNVNALIVGAAYIVVLVVSLAFCLKRRLSVRLGLARIPKGRIAIGKGDLPKAVHILIEEELLRSCAIAYTAQPRIARRDGWGTPGTKHENVRFRTAILDTIPSIDKAARKVIPSMPSLSPHVPLSRHLRHIMPLVSADALGEMHFRAYTDAVEKARYAEQELTEEEFGAAVDSGAAISDILTAYQRVLSERNNFQ